MEFGCSPVTAWVLYGYCSFLTQSNSMLVRLIGDSKLDVGENAYHALALG